MNCEVGRQHRLLGAHQCGRGTSGGMVGEGGNYAGVDIPVLLAETGDNCQLGFQPVRADSDQSDTQVRYERRIGQHLFDLRMRLARGSSSSRFPIRTILSETHSACNPKAEWAVTPAKEMTFSPSGLALVAEGWSERS
jgi:hypothetical protein